MDSKKWANVTLCVIVGIALIWAAAGSGSILGDRGLFARSPEVSATVRESGGAVELMHYSLGEGPGHQVEGTFVIANRSDRDIRDSEVVCEFFDAERTYLDQARWILAARIPAGETMELDTLQRRFVHSRAAKISCSLVDFSPIRKQLFTVHRSHGTAHEGGGASPSHGGSDH